MPALAHIGVGFAAKKITPKLSVGYLILAAEFVEIIFIILWIACVEYPPTEDKISFSPYSHSLIMGLLWSILAAIVTFIFNRNKRLSLIIGLLVFSHTLLDIIASPKTAFYPNDTGMPIFLNVNVTVGFGLWKNKIIGLVGEYGILAAGIFIYILVIRKNKKTKTINQPINNKP